MLRHHFNLPNSKLHLSRMVRIHFDGRTLLDWLLEEKDLVVGILQDNKLVLVLVEMVGADVKLISREDPIRMRIPCLIVEKYQGIVESEVASNYKGFGKGYHLFKCLVVE